MRIRLSSSCQDKRYGLISIDWKYVKKIICGEKWYEFRKRRIVSTVDVVLIYAKQPIGKVLAEFDLVRIITEPLDRLWETTKRGSSMNKHCFCDYFCDRPDRREGTAIQIGDVRCYKEPFDPEEKLGVEPPQAMLRSLPESTYRIIQGMTFIR